MYLSALVGLLFRFDLWTMLFLAVSMAGGKTGSNRLHSQLPQSAFIAA